MFPVRRTPLNLPLEKQQLQKCPELILYTDHSLGVKMAPVGTNIMRRRKIRGGSSGIKKVSAVMDVNKIQSM